MTDQSRMPEVSEDRELADRVEARILPALASLVQSLNLVRSGEIVDLSLADTWKLVEAAIAGGRVGSYVPIATQRAGKRLVSDVECLRLIDRRFALGPLFVERADIEQRAAEFAVQIVALATRESARLPHNEGIW
jgi:hypothetical protein